MTEINNGFVFPQDSGTGMSSFDEHDGTSAGYFGGLVAQSNSTNYVERGMEFQNVGDGTFDVSDGLAFIRDADTVSVQDENGDYVRDWSQGITYVVHADTTTGVEYTEGDINHVFILIDRETNNGVEYLVNTTGDEPGQVSLKIGEIDDT